MLNKVTLLDPNGETLYDGLIYRLPLREDAILAYGAKIYGERTLCAMRREVVRKRLYFELEEAIVAQAQQDALPLSALGAMAQYLDFSHCALP